MAFTDELWRAIEPIYAAILRHPFLRGLTDGALPRESFQFYALQDALYLREFARALSLAAARAPRDAWIIMFNEHAAGALQVERSLHESFFKEFGLTEADVAATPLAPTNLGYCSYLIATAYGSPFYEAVAALCPATGSTGRSARRSSERARAIHSTRAGSVPTPPPSSAPSSRRCSRRPTRSPPGSVPRSAGR